VVFIKTWTNSLKQMSLSYNQNAVNLKIIRHDLNDNCNLNHNFTNQYRIFTIQRVNRAVAMFKIVFSSDSFDSVT